MSKTPCHHPLLKSIHVLKCTKAWYAWTWLLNIESMKQTNKIGESWGRQGPSPPIGVTAWANALEYDMSTSLILVFRLFPALKYTSEHLTHRGRYELLRLILILFVNPTTTRPRRPVYAFWMLTFFDVSAFNDTTTLSEDIKPADLLPENSVDLPNWRSRWYNSNSVYIAYITALIFAPVVYTWSKCG